MTIRAFTGPSRLTTAQRAFVRDVLHRLSTADEVRSGAAFGVDTEAAVIRRGWKMTLVVPEGLPHNADLVQDQRLLPAVTVQRVRGGYRARNEALVAGATELHAFVHSPDFYRSGEWMTINIARRRGVPVTLHLLPEGGGS